MRLALIGDHADGRAFARAAVANGRHELVVYCGSAPDFARQLNPQVRLTADLEDVLADPTVEACVVAVPVKKRLEAVRRVLQSERPAAVVHPVSLTTDGAYELEMLQGDTHQALLPLIGEHLDVDAKANDPQAIFELTIADRTVSLEHGEGKDNPALPGWTLLRRAGGEIAEVSAFAETEDVVEDRPLVVMGRFERGGLFQVVFQPRPDEPSHDDDSDVWPTLVGEWENEVAFFTSVQRADPAAGPKTRDGALVSWHDEIRALELDDAAHRSLRKRRSSLLEYQEASEEVGFKGTMTLLGCALLWGSIVLLILSAWLPWIGWLILPAILLFIAMQALGRLTK